MTVDPFRDEAAQLLARKLRLLERQVGACQSSALVLTLEIRGGRLKPSYEL